MTDAENETKKVCGDYISVIPLRYSQMLQWEIIIGL